jgi:hypothetical protein
MSGFVRPTNYVGGPEEIIRKARAKLRKKKPQPLCQKKTSQEEV